MKHSDYFVWNFFTKAVKESTLRRKAKKLEKYALSERIEWYVDHWADEETKALCIRLWHEIDGVTETPPDSFKAAWRLFLATDNGQTPAKDFYNPDFTEKYVSRALEVYKEYEARNEDNGQLIEKKDYSLPEWYEIFWEIHDYDVYHR